MLTYVQGHQFDTDRLGPGQDRYDGVAMPSFDSPKDAAALVDDPRIAFVLVGNGPDKAALRQEA